MKRFILALLLLTLATNSLSAHWLSNFISTLKAAVRSNSQITLPNGVQVSKARFNRVYVGIKDIFGDNAHQGDQFVDLNFLKSIVDRDYSGYCHLGWGDPRHTFLTKEVLYHIAQNPDVFYFSRNSIDEIDSLLHDFDYNIFSDTILAQIYGEDTLHFCPLVPNWKAGDLIQKLGNHDIIRQFPEQNKVGIDAEAIAILNAIIAKKTSQHVPYLKELSEFIKNK